MNVLKKTAYGGILAALTVSLSIGTLMQVQAKPRLDRQAVASNLSSLTRYAQVVAEAKTPEVPKPNWYKDQVAAERRAAQAAAAPSTSAGNRQTVTYTIATKGSTKSNIDQFAALAHQTLNDARGWAKLNIAFVRVPSGGNFNLVLSEASQLPTFSPGCSAEWSCRVGTSVIINETRWDGATPAWNAAGGGIRDYRHMVINHEVGHWLGHGHYGCPAAGNYAPVMLQQSIDLQGCKFNPWPLASELRAPNLGL